jgi:hypothetical protein
MPNIGDAVIDFVTGMSGTVISKATSFGGTQYSASGAYDSIPYHIYGVRWSDRSTAGGLVDGDFGGQTRRIRGTELNDITVPWRTF